MQVGTIFNEMNCLYVGGRNGCGAGPDAISPHHGHGSVSPCPAEQLIRLRTTAQSDFIGVAGNARATLWVVSWKRWKG